MSLNDLLSRADARRLDDARHIAHAAGLEQAATLVHDYAETLYGLGAPDEAEAMLAAELMLRRRAVERLALAEHCPTCSAVLSSHVHLSHCADGPERSCDGSSCSISTGSVQS